MEVVKFSARLVYRRSQGGRCARLKVNCPPPEVAARWPLPSLDLLSGTAIVSNNGKNRAVLQTSGEDLVG